MNAPTLQEVVEAKADALFSCWQSRFALDGMRVLSVESEFRFPLINPETEAASRTFSEAGKMDVLLQDGNGRVWVMEHKTTSDGLAPDSDYWTRLRMDTQCSKYFMAAMQMGHDVAGIIYNVARRPQHQLKSIPILDPDGYKIVLDRNGRRVLTKDGKKPRETADLEMGCTLETRPETLGEFAVRVGAEIASRPADYFATREVPRLESDILEYMADTWACGQQILYFRNRSLWPRNPMACSAFGACEFFDLCAGRASVDGVSYAFTEAAHRELKAQADGDRELLTNSRQSALRKCCRLHELRYEQKVMRCGDEPEALSFGQAMHARWEKFFKNLATDTANQH